MEHTLNERLLAPVNAIFAAQERMDRQTVLDLQKLSTEQCILQVSGRTVEVPRLLLTGVRSMSIATARITLDFQQTAVRLRSDTASVSMSLQMEPIPNLGDLIMETTEPGRHTQE